MVIRFGTYPASVHKGFFDDVYFKSIEVCCPMMAFHYRNEDLFELSNGTLDLENNPWPLMLNTDHCKLAVEVPIYNCPHCGKPVHVYVDDKLYKNSEELSKLYS